MLILSADVGVPVRGAHQDFASLTEVNTYGKFLYWKADDMVLNPSTVLEVVIDKLLKMQ